MCQSNNIFFTYCSDGVNTKNIIIMKKSSNDPGLDRQPRSLWEIKDIQK